MKGKIIQVVGVVVDVEFEKADNLPAINDALTVKQGKKTIQKVGKTPPFQEQKEQKNQPFHKYSPHAH